MPTDTTFGRQYRLNKPSEFNRVFENAAVRRRCGPLRMLAVANEAHTARLGLVVGKRALPRAVDRNRVKRLIREAFRNNRSELVNMDIVIQVVAPVARPLDAAAVQAAAAGLLAAIQREVA